MHLYHFYFDDGPPSRRFLEEFIFVKIANFSISNDPCMLSMNFFLTKRHMVIAGVIRYQMVSKVFLWVPPSTCHVTLNMTRHPSKNRFLGDIWSAVIQGAELNAK